MRPSKARSELSVGLACHLRWVTYEEAVHFAAGSSHTRGGSRMRESRTSGFVRGAHSNMCPYRDPYKPDAEKANNWSSPCTFRDSIKPRAGQPFQFGSIRASLNGK